jgi:uncharacterized integral membrane protein
MTSFQILIKSRPYKEDEAVQFFYWLIFLVAFAMAILAVQNSNAPLVMIKFLVWRFETSLIYTVLGSAATGILVTLFLWVPRAIKSSIRLRELKKRLENVGTASNELAKRIEAEKQT